MKRIFNITFTAYPKLVIVLIYKRGKLSEIKGLENLNNVTIFEWLQRIAPQKLDDVDFKCEGVLFKLKGRLEYSEVIKEKTLFQSMVAEWQYFFLEKFGFEANFRGVEGKAIKGIIAYLRKLSDNNDKEVIAIWKNLLSRTDELDQFTQSKISELTFINSKLATILLQLKEDTDDRSI